MRNFSSSSLTGQKNPYLVWIEGILVFLVCFALAFLCGSLSFIPFSSSAEESASTDVVVDISPVLSLRLDTNAIDLKVFPTLSGVDTSGVVNAYVSTNNISGYTLVMHTPTTKLHLRTGKPLSISRSMFGMTRSSK